MIYKHILLMVVALIGFSGCSTITDKPPEVGQTAQSINARTAQLIALNHWQLSGKMAFIQAKKRQSATLFWRHNEKEQTESLNLSTIFGINILQLERKQQRFTLEVDGQTYQSDDLDQLIFSLTGLELPTRALNHWLKGIAFLATDHIVYDKQSQLPTSLTSEYNHKAWQISYANYHLVSGYQLAKKFTISQNDLVIKISVNNWTI